MFVNLVKPNMRRRAQSHAHASPINRFTLISFYKQLRFWFSTQVAYQIGPFEYSSCLSVA